MGKLLWYNVKWWKQAINVYVVYTYLYMRVFPISLYAYEKDQKVKSPKYC